MGAKFPPTLFCPQSCFKRGSPSKHIPIANFAVESMQWPDCLIMHQSLPYARGGYPSLRKSFHARDFKHGRIFAGLRGKFGEMCGDVQLKRCKKRLC